MYVLMTIVGQVLGRLLDPFGWVLNLVLYFALRRKLVWWGSALSAAAIGAVVLQLVLWGMLSAEGRTIRLDGLFWWFLTGLLECGIAELVAFTVRSVRGKST